MLLTSKVFQLTSAILATKMAMIVCHTDVVFICLANNCWLKTQIKTQ
jgi:hypothetical protein